MNWQSVWTVAAFFLGGLSSYIRDWVTEKRQRDRLNSERQADRQRAILDRRETFELDHLIKLNEALNDLARAAGKVHHHDVMTSRETGAYAGTLLSGGIDQDLLDANRAVNTIRGLVLDDQLRAQVTQTHRLLNEPSSMHFSDPVEAQRVFARAILTLEETQAAIAARIRDIYTSQGESGTMPAQRGATVIHS